jgi:hypothetical protein
VVQRPTATHAIMPKRRNHFKDVNGIAFCIVSLPIEPLSNPLKNGLSQGFIAIHVTKIERLSGIPAKFDVTAL